MSGDWLMQWLVVQSVQLTALAVAIGVVARIFLGHRPHLAHALWLVVIAKCVVPPVWAGPVGLFSWIRTRQPTSVGMTLPLPITETNRSEQMPSTPTGGESTANTTVGKGQASAINDASPSTRQIFSEAAVGIWLFGVLVAMTLNLLRVRIVARRLGSGKPPDARLAAIAKEVGRAIGLAHPPRVIGTSDFGPGVVGTLRPTVVLPRRVLQVDRTGLQTVLGHELAHVRRSDSLVAAIQRLVVAIYWFHPAVWWASSQLTAAREQCCDQETVVGLGLEPEQYAQSLLKIASPQALLLGVNTMHLTQSRLELLMDRRVRFHGRPPRWSWLAAVVIALLVLPGAGLLSSEHALGAAPPGTQPADMSWTPQKICATELWREPRLANSSWSFSEDLTLLTDNGPKHWQTITADVRCRDGAFRYDLSMKHYIYPALSLDHMLQTWDGGTSTTLVHESAGDGTVRLKASINGHKPDLLGDTEFFSVLGTQYFGSPDGTLYGFLQHVLAVKGSKALVTSESIAGNACIKLTLWNIEGSAGQFEFWFDPNKDFVERKWRWTIPDRPTKNSYDGFDVTRCAQLDGFWVPVDVDVFVGRGRTDENKFMCHLTAFSAAQPSADSMRVVFPEGTQVMDSTHMQNYVVGANGTKYYREFYDVATKKIIQPSTQSTTAGNRKLIAQRY